LSKTQSDQLTEPPSHLTPATAALLAEPCEIRIQAILSERWILYPRAKHALDQLNKLIDHPRTTRMPSIAIFGDSGMGKTMIMQRFCAENSHGFDPNTGRERTPVLSLQMSGHPTERRLYALILAALGAPQGPRADITRLEQSAVSLLKTIGTQVLVIDEVHNILAGSHREQRIVLNALRFLSNELRMSLVCFGVTDAREAISGDVQLARRFDELTLPRWLATAQYEALIISILRNMPLREPSILTAKSLRRILQVTEGLTALIFRMLNELAIAAAKTGVERITDEAVESWKPNVQTEAAFS
jgi:hypothetical protein